MKRFRYAFVAFALSVMFFIPAARMLVSVFTDRPVALDDGAPVTLAIAKPGRITIWYYTEAIIDSRYTHATGIPDGVKIEARFRDKSLPVGIDRSSTMNVGDGERKSAFVIHAEEPGDYTLQVSDIPADLRLAASTGFELKRLLRGFMMAGLGGVFAVTTLVLVVLAATGVFPQTPRPSPPPVP